MCTQVFLCTTLPHQRDALSGHCSVSVRHAAGPLRPAQQAWVCAYRSLWLVVRCFLLSPYKTYLCSPFLPAAWEEASDVCCAHIDVPGAEAPYLILCVAFRWVPQLWLSFSLARIVSSLFCELSRFCLWLSRGGAGLHPDGQMLVWRSRAVRAPSLAAVELQHFICACVFVFESFGFVALALYFLGLLYGSFAFVGDGSCQGRICHD